MTGLVDSLGRAILRVRLKAADPGPASEVDVWIDTGFTGELVLPGARITALGLPLGPKVEAVLADGSVIQLDTFTCLVDWFGQWRLVEVVANQGQSPLLGVGLLMDRTLHIDYAAKTVSVD